MYTKQAGQKSIVKRCFATVVVTVMMEVVYTWCYGTLVVLLCCQCVVLTQCPCFVYVLMIVVEDEAKVSRASTDRSMCTGFRHCSLSSSLLDVTRTSSFLSWIQVLERTVDDINVELWSELEITFLRLLFQV